MSIFKVQDIDQILLSFLNIDDSRNLYQINTYYRNLINPILTRFIRFFSIAHKIKIANEKYINKTLARSIIFGDYSICQYLYKKHKVDAIHDLNKLFKLACIKNKYVIAQWLCNIGADVAHDHHEAFRLSCQGGHIKIIKWLYAHSSMQLVNIEDGFIFCCLNDHTEAAKWIYSKNTSCATIDSIAKIFTKTCLNGHLETAKWLYSLEKIPNHILDCAFVFCCRNNHLEIAKWLYSLGIDFRFENDWGLAVSCFRGHIKVAKWLCTLYSGYCVTVHNGNIKYIVS